MRCQKIANIFELLVASFEGDQIIITNDRRQTGKG
jgi:hypothetical protein